MWKSLSPFILLLVICTHPPVWAEEFCFDEAGRTFTLPPLLLRSIATIESGMNQSARNLNSNGTTDLGLMQVNSSWINKARLDKERLSSDACYNTLAGARILRGCIDRHGYTWEAVGCYNAASSDKRKIYAWKVFRQLANNKKQQYGQGALAPGTGKPYEDQQQFRSSSLTISFDDQGEAALGPQSQGSFESKVALEQKEAIP